MAETSKYSIIVSERATQMLLSHITFLSQVSLTAARKLVQDFDTQIQSLEFMPMRRPFFNADYIPQNTYHFILIGKRYMILFQIKDCTVFVDYVLDCRQDYSWLI